MEQDGTAEERVWYYLICTVCGAKFRSKNREKPCPRCSGPSKPRGIKVG